MKQALAFTLSFVLTASAFAAPAGQSGSSATASSSTKTKKKKATASASAAETTARQLSEMKAALDAQQQQIQQLQQQVQSRDQAVQSLQQRIDQSQQAAQAAQDKANSAAATASALQSDVTDLKSNSTSAAVSLQETQKQVKEGFEHPTSIHFKGITITPGGFIAAETVTRNKGTSGDINTPFTGIPFAGNDLAKLSEFNFSARQSRLTLLLEGKAGDVKYSGYFEGDFLGAGVTSNNRQSNSYVFRQRQLFARVDLPSGWAFTAGQQWCLCTENTKGIVNRGERFPLQIDPQYIVGFTWQRAYALRVVKSWDKIALGFSLEGPQTTVGGRGFSSTSDTSAIGVVTATQNFFVNAPGAGGGLYNFADTTGYTVNKLPDFMAKLALDPGFGHYEIFGILSDFRNRVYPCAVVGTTATNTPPGVIDLPCPVDGSVKPSALGAFNDSRLTGGAGASATWTVLDKKLDFGLKVVGGDGIGRYGSAQLADVTARPDGTLAPIRTAHYLTSFAVHPNKKFDLYAYWGQEYAARADYVGYQSVKVTHTPAVTGIPSVSTTTISTTGVGGYGSPYFNNSGCSVEGVPAATGTPSGGSSCAGDIRVISEATVGFWHKVYQGDRGRFQWGLQYSYIWKLGWSGNNTSPTAPIQPAGIVPKAIDNMLFTSIRYYLP